MKVLIIGLDGATWDVFDDFLLTHHMPNLKKLKCEGYSGVLQSTEPPVTPAAWTTCLTGCQPYTHGVVGFREYSFKDDRLRISSASSCLVPTIWQELSKQGYKVASINVPWTYPCQEINGIMVAGYGAPGIFTYPEDFRYELLKKIPDYDIVAEIDRPIRDTQPKFASIIDRVERSFTQRLEAAKLVTTKMDWDIMMVEFQELDQLGHYMWPYFDRNTRDAHAPQRDRLLRMFEKLDEAIGALLDLGKSQDLMVAVVSDHGLGRRIADVKPNAFLYYWGYLKFQSRMRRMVRRCRRNLYSLLSVKKDSMVVELKMPIDWKRSKAVVLKAAISGYLYLNVKGRQPLGCVRAGKEYDAIIKDLCARFSQVTDPRTGEAVFTQVATPAELYNIGSADAERFGDLILVPRSGYFLKSSMITDKNCVEPLPAKSLEGCHYKEGIYVFFGKNVKVTNNKQAQIVDFAPTIYAALGAKVPSCVDGRVLKEIFFGDIEIHYQEQDSEGISQNYRKVELSDSEEAAVAKRLSRLGYLD